MFFLEVAMQSEVLNPLFQRISVAIHHSLRNGNGGSDFDWVSVHSVVFRLRISLAVLNYKKTSSPSSFGVCEEKQRENQRKRRR